MSNVPASVKQLVIKVVYVHNRSATAKIKHQFPRRLSPPDHNSRIDLEYALIDCKRIKFAYYSIVVNDLYVSVECQLDDLDAAIIEFERIIIEMIYS